MKKIFKIITILGLTSLLLISCGSKSAKTKITDGDKVVFSVNNNTITNQDVYEYAKLKYGGTIVPNRLVKEQMSQKVEVTPELEQKARENFEADKAKYGEQFPTLLTYWGYADENAYYEDVNLGGLIAEKMFDDYINANFEATVTKYSTKKIRVIKVDNKEKAQSLLDQLVAVKGTESEITFESLAKEHSLDATKGAETYMSLFEDSSQDAVYSEILKSKKTGLIEQVYISGSYYYVFQIEEINMEAEKAAIIEVFKKDSSGNAKMNLDMVALYCKENNFKVYDEDIMGMIESSYPQFLGK